MHNEEVTELKIREKMKKKIEDFGNARSSFDNHPFPTKQMQNKIVINSRAMYL